MPCDCADTRVITSLNLRWLTFVDRKENREERIEVIYHEKISLSLSLYIYIFLYFFIMSVQIVKISLFAKQININMHFLESSSRCSYLLN